jgi:hypothetical protein
MFSRALVSISSDHALCSVSLMCHSLFLWCFVQMRASTCLWRALEWHWFRLWFYCSQQMEESEKCQEGQKISGCSTGHRASSSFLHLLIEQILWVSWKRNLGSNSRIFMYILILTIRHEHWKRHFCFYVRKRSITNFDCIACKEYTVYFKREEK